MRAEKAVGLDATEVDPVESAEAMDPVGRTAAWRSLADAILAGFCHELGGRASAFVSIAHLATRESVREGFVLGEIERESERLTRLASLLRVLPRHTGDGPRPTAVHGAVEEALELARYHHGLRFIELSAEALEGLPAVRICKNAFTQSILILLAATARRALTSGYNRVRVSGSDEGREVVLRIESVAEPTPDWGLSAWMDTPPPVIDAASVETVRMRWAEERGSVSSTASGGYELRIPKAADAG